MDATSDQYFLARHAHLCVLRGRIVVLDVVSGKYLSLDPAAAHSLRRFVSGWPELEGPAENPAALELLLSRGLLTRDQALGKPAQPVEICTPSTWIGEVRPGGSPHVGVQHAWRFFRAAAAAGVSLRAMRLQTILDRVSRRKALHRGHVSVELSTVAELLRVFDWLRPLAFDKKDACFLYCLAMVEFLAYYGVFPDWIFGVRDRPFKAHCWLQQEKYLFSDIPYGVRELTPIMVV